jgi:hypothetical protein
MYVNNILYQLASDIFYGLFIFPWWLSAAK